MNRVQCICRTETHELRRPFGFVEPSRRQETDAHPNERRRDLLHDGRAERVGDRRIRGRIVCCHGCSYPLKAKYAMTDAAMSSGTAEARGSGSITSMLEVCFCARSSASSEACFCAMASKRRCSPSARAASMRAFADVRMADLWAATAAFAAALASSSLLPTASAARLAMLYMDSKARASPMPMDAVPGRE